MLRDIKIVAKDIKMMPKDFIRCQKTFRDAQKLKRHPVTQYDVLRLAYIMIGGLSYKSLPHISRITIKKTTFGFVTIVHKQFQPNGRSPRALNNETHPITTGPGPNL